MGSLWCCLGVHADADSEKDLVGFRMFPLYLSNDEVAELKQAVDAALKPFARNEKSPVRRRFVVGLTSIPDLGGAPVSATPPTGTGKVVKSNSNKG